MSQGLVNGIKNNAQFLGFKNDSMSQGLVNGIKNNAQFLGFKNDRGVIPLFTIFHANL